MINSHFDRCVSKPAATIKFRSAPSWKKNIHSKPYLFTTLVCEIFDPFTPVREPISVGLAIPHSKKIPAAPEVSSSGCLPEMMGPKGWNLLETMGTHNLRGYNPYIGGVKPSFFMVLGSHGMLFLMFYTAEMVGLKKKVICFQICESVRWILEV